jgi:HEAT repeat protein
MLKVMRPNIFTTLLVAAVALAACLFAAGAHAQRGASRQANDNAAAGARQKRVIVGRGSDTNKGSRVTITADDSLKDYSAYRSGDRFYVVLPKSAAGAARAGGGGKGYSDMQVQQRGDSVVLSYRVQPGAKPRVEQKFNRLDVVFDVPEGAQQSASTAAQGDAGRQSQPAPAENRNASTAGQQSSQNQTASQQQNAAGANERRPTPAEAARAQAEAARAQGEAAQSNAGQPQPAVVPAPADGAQGVTAPPSSTTEQPQETATAAASPSAEPQIAQAQAPGAVEPITTARPGTEAQTAGTSLGTFLLRNWGLALIFAMIVVGLGLVIAARRTSTQAKTEGEVLDDAATPTLDAPRAKLVEPRVKPLDTSTVTPLAASTTTQAATNASTTPAAKTAPAATSTPAAAATPAAAELDAVGEQALDAAPIAAATALAGAAAAKSRKQSRKDARQEARKKKKGGRAADAAQVDEIAVEGAVAEPVAEEVVAESAAEETVAKPVAEMPATESVAEAVVAKSLVEETAAVPAAEETPAEVEAAKVEVEEVTRAVEVSDLKAPAAEASEVVAEASNAEASGAPVAEESRNAFGMDAAPPAAAVVSSVAEVVSRPSEVADRSEVEAAELTPAVVEPEPVVEQETAVEPVAVEVTPAEVAAVETPRPKAEESRPEAVTRVSEIVPALAPDHETVQAETRRLLEGEEYDRAVVGTRDPVARQMVAAELLYVLAGRNEARRRRAGAAFVEQGFHDEASRDLRDADAPAERAAAARSLALLGDRKATPLLVAALEDPSSEVRRAAVEALGSLRDPSAVPPLEALLERERNERNRIPGRVILNAVQSCREGAAEVTAEAPASHVETESVVKAVEPVAASETVVAEEAVRAAESVTAVEPARFMPGEEDAAPAAPLVEERGVEPVIEAEEEETLAVVAERPDADEVRAVAGEGRAVAHDPQSPAEELQAAEARSSEPVIAEPRSVVETRIRPLFVQEEDAEEVTREVAAAPASEVGLEPRTRTEEEAAQPALFGDDSAEVRGIEPFASDEAKPSTGGVVTGEWFDLDMNDFHGAGQPAAADTHAVEPAAHATEPASHAGVFESSSGDAIATPAEPAAFVFEPEPAAARDDVTARGLDLIDAGETVTAPLTRPAETRERAHAFAPESAEKGIAPLDEYSAVPAAIQHGLASDDPAERAAAVVELSHVDTDEAFHQICDAFDDRSEQVRSAAARALYELRPERADSFTRALREATPERRREIGTSISASGLAGEAISQLTGESREKTYEAFSLLFLMAKAGEVQPLVRAIESHPNNEVRLAVVKLLALSGQKEILPAFRRLAVRGSLPTEVRSAVMEAIYQISSNQPTHA